MTPDEARERIAAAWVRVGQAQESANAAAARAAEALEEFSRACLEAEEEVHGHGIPYS